MKKGDITKEKILTAAEDIFSEKGFSGAMSISKAKKIFIKLYLTGCMADLLKWKAARICSFPWRMF